MLKFYVKSIKLKILPEMIPLQSQFQKFCLRRRDDIWLLRNNSPKKRCVHHWTTDWRWYQRHWW